MAYYERGYYQEARSPLGGRLGTHSVVTWLLILNAAVFVLDFILSAGSRMPWWTSLSYWGNFNVGQGLFGFQIWRVFTYQFLHAGLFHLLFNMIGLFFFGPMLEGWWGGRRFLAFYLLCGASGAVVMTILSFIPGLLSVTPATALVGASGSVYGILIGVAVLFPHQRVQLLFPPIPMTMRTMALVFLGIAFLSVLAGTPNAGGEAAHLGGAALGFVLAKKPRWLGWAEGVDPAEWRDRTRRRRLQAEIQREIDEDRNVDRILDKVREHGLQSLTRREKKTLHRATERHRRAG